MSEIILSQDEARELLDVIPGSKDFSEQTRLQAMIGVMGVVAALQQLGYRIAKPLRAVNDR